MSWDFAYKVGPKGGTLSPLSDYCVFVRIADEGSMAPLRGSDPTALYRHGTVPQPRKWVTPGRLVLETGIRYTDPTGAVTHADGPAGHFYENLAALKQLFGGDQATLVTVERTAPHIGTVQVDGQLMVEPAATQQRWVFAWILSLPHPFWRSTTLRTGLSSPVTVGGNAPVDDFVMHIVGGTDVTVTHDQSGAKFTVVGATPAGGIDIDVGAGTILNSGSDAADLVEPSEPWWMELNPGVNTFTITGAPTSVTVDLRDQWR